MENIKKNEDFVIWEEILSQQYLIKKSIEKIINYEKEFLRLFNNFKDIYFIGCGSSYHVAMIVQFIASKFLKNCRFHSVVASDFIIYPQFFIKDNLNKHNTSDKALYILISRTGQTSELLHAADIVRARYKKSLAISTFSNSSLVKKCDFSIILEEMQEKSITATRSVTSTTALLVGLIFLIGGKNSYIEKIISLNDIFFKNLTYYIQTIDLIIKNEILDKFVFLGSGPFFGVSKEAELKVKEMSLTNTESNQPLEFRHGHKAIINSKCLTTFFISDDGFDYEIHTIRELKKLGSKILVICNKNKLLELNDLYDYKIEIVTKDDEGSPEKSFLVAQEMVDEEVLGVIGSTFDGTTKVAIPVLEDYNIPILSPYAQKTEISKVGNNFFRAIINNKQKIENIASFIKNEVKPQKLILIDNREEYSIQLIDYLISLLSDNNIEILRRYSIKIGEDDLNTLVENLYIDEPDVIFFCAGYGELALLLETARDFGLENRFITEAMGMDDRIFTITEAKNLEGLTAIVPEPPSLSRYSEDIKAIEYWRDYNELLGRAGHLDISIDRPGIYGPYAYDSIFMLAEAMKEANSILPHEYIDELKKISFDGVTGHIEFNSNGDRLDPLSTVFIIRDGVWVRYH